jgi:hypothetical protein
MLEIEASFQEAVDRLNFPLDNFARGDRNAADSRREYSPSTTWELPDGPRGPFVEKS